MSAMKKMLADFCPEVLVVGEATCIKDALLLIVTRKPELAFLDIQLPDGNSFALVNALANSNTRVIFTTAYNDYALKALKCAALDYLLKPVNIDELIIAIGKYKTYREQIDYSLSLKVLQENMGRELKEKIKTIGLATINEIIFVETDLIIRLEAAVYGKPVLIGPIYDKYLEAVALVENGGCISVENALELEAELVTLLEDASAYQEASVAAKNYVFAKAGATKTILDYIQANRLLTN